MTYKHPFSLYPETADLNDYLTSDAYIESNHPEIIDLARQLTGDTTDPIAIIRRLYHFVRDQVAHSWDVQDKRVTVTATDVLHARVGICYAKSNLLAALLRSRAIPAGICYQKLVLGETLDTGYCIHALNAVWLAPAQRWIRLDARGNKEGICAEFYPDHEQLAFPVNASLGERDYPCIYTKPLPVTMKTLENSSDALYMYCHSLPQDI